MIRVSSDSWLRQVVGNGDNGQGRDDLGTFGGEVDVLPPPQPCLVTMRNGPSCYQE